MRPRNAWYRIVHRKSNRSLDGDGTFYINSANQSIRLIDWSDSPYQRWRFNRIDDNYYAIVNNVTGKYLDGGSLGSDGNKRVSTSTAGVVKSMLLCASASLYPYHLIVNSACMGTSLNILCLPAYTDVQNCECTYIIRLSMSFHLLALEISNGCFSLLIGLSWIASNI